MFEIYDHAQVMPFQDSARLELARVDSGRLDFSGVPCFWISRRLHFENMDCEELI